MKATELLLLAGILDRQRLEAIREEAGGLPDDWGELCNLLAARGIASEAELLQAAGRLYALPVMLEVPDEALDPELVRDLPVQWAREHLALPVRPAGRPPSLLLSDPARITLAHDVSVLLGTEVTPVLAPREVIRAAIEKCYLRQERRPADIAAPPAESTSSPERPPGTDLLLSPDGAPVTQMANLILLNAVRADASDVHIEPGPSGLRVRYRIDGVLYEQEPPPREMEAALISRLKIMAGLDIAERRLPQDGTARVRVGDRVLDLRVSCVPVADGERVVLRILHRDSILLPLDSLGMVPDMVEAFRRLLAQPQGAIWVTGPTGSGKTTTLYAALRELDCAHLNIMTIEDPVEYRLPEIGQMAVKPKIGLTFATGLRHILRQDPDVILVGETRDQETAEIAVRAALTGHLVLSTLHTTDAAGAVIRLMDMGVPPYLLAASISGVLAQRLVRRLCPHCRQPTSVPPDLPLEKDEVRLLQSGTVFRAAGCPQCLEGYRGRTGIFELMVVEEDLREMVRRGPDHAALVRAARGRGMRSLREDGMAKVAAGITSLDELLRAVGWDADGR